MGQVHWIRFAECEDEAQQTGMAFQPQGDGTVETWSTWNGYPDLEDSTRKVISISDARQLYRELLDSGRYEK